MEANDKGLNIVRVELDSNMQPIAKYRPNKEYILWGENNNYPNYIIELYKRDAINGAIINGKSDYVFGKGLCYDQENTPVVQQAIIQSFINKANDSENWNDILRKTCKTFELFNGWAWQIVWKIGGIRADIYVMQIAKLRRSKDGKKIYYCEKWVNDDGSPNSFPQRHPSYKEMDAFNPQIRTGTQIYFFKNETVSGLEYGDLYPEPFYLPCIQDIETNIEITNHSYNTIINGMSAGSIVTFFNGDPGPQEKKKIAQLFKRTHAGSNNAGKAILNFADKGSEAAAVTALTPPDTYQQFIEMSKRVQQNIFTGHNANPILFGIQTDNGISNPTGDQILTEWDKFQKSYVEHRQKIILDEIKFIGSILGYDLNELYIEPKAPVNAELPLDNPIVLNLLSQDELRGYLNKKYDLKLEDYSQELLNANKVINAIKSLDPKIGQKIIDVLSQDEIRNLVDVQDTNIIPTPQQPVEQQQINEHLKNLTGRQWQNVKRIQREFGNKKISKEQAAMLLKSSLGLDQQSIETLLAQPAAFSSQDRLKKAIQLFEQNAIDDNDEDELVFTEFVERGKDYSFAEGDKSLGDKILDLLKGDPTLGIDKLNKLLGITVAGSILGNLLNSGHITSQGGLFTPTEKGLNKSTPIVETEVYTVYAYVTRPDVPEVETSSREFCQRLMTMSRNGKRWTREAIDNITNDIGEDAWTYRGGFYSNPKTGETTPYCRHLWKAIIKTRKKK